RGYRPEPLEDERRHDARPGAGYRPAQHHSAHDIGRVVHADVDARHAHRPSQAHQGTSNRRGRAKVPSDHQQVGEEHAWMAARPGGAARLLDQEPVFILSFVRPGAHDRFLSELPDPPHRNRRTKGIEPRTPPPHPGKRDRRPDRRPDRAELGDALEERVGPGAARAVDRVIEPAVGRSPGTPMSVSPDRGRASHRRRRPEPPAPAHGGTEPIWSSGPFAASSKMRNSTSPSTVSPESANPHFWSTRIEPKLCLATYAYRGRSLTCPRNAERASVATPL